MDCRITPPAETQQKLSWFAMRFERWQEEAERIGLRPVHLEDLSGALGSAAVAFVEHEEQGTPAAERKLEGAVRELDTAGGSALDAVLGHASASGEPDAVLQRAMLDGHEPAAG